MNWSKCFSSSKYVHLQKNFPLKISLPWQKNFNVYSIFGKCVWNFHHVVYNVFLTEIHPGYSSPCHCELWSFVVERGLEEVHGKHPCVIQLWKFLETYPELHVLVSGWRCCPAKCWVVVASTTQIHVCLAPFHIYKSNLKTRNFEIYQLSKDIQVFILYSIWNF